MGCKRSSSTSCYDTPRTVVLPRCSAKPDKVCETMPQRSPTVSERQHCRNVPRKVCENADNKSLVPSCVPSVRKQCTYHPAESCDEIPKQHCFKVGKKVRQEKCEAASGGSDSGYPA